MIEGRWQWRYDVDVAKQLVVKVVAYVAKQHILLEYTPECAATQHIGE